MTAIYILMMVQEVIQLNSFTILATIQQFHLLLN